MAPSSSTRPPHPPAPPASPAMAHPGDVPQDRRPHFFKVFFPCHSSKRLGIPPGFWKHMEHQTPGGVSLIGPSGNAWCVDLVRDGDGGISFQNGWKEFVGDHSLETGDFLLFRYDGDLRFTVLVFGSTACEKEEAFHAVPCEEVVVLGESCPRQCATDLSPKELIILDPNTERALPHKKGTLVATSQEFVKNNTDPVENHPEGRSHVNDGSIVTNEDNIDCSSEQDLLALQIRPSTLLHNLQPDVGANSDRTTLRHSTHKEPRGSNRCPPSWKQSSHGQLTHVIHEVKEEPQTDQDTSSANSGKSVPKERRTTKMEADKSTNLCGGNFKDSTQKHKEPAPAMRSPHKKTGSAVKQPHCSKCSRCSGSSNIDDVRINVRMGCAVSCRRPITEHEKAKALEAALAFKSEHPVGICVMRDSYVYYGYYMSLPISFIQHLPNRSMKLQLWDPSDRPWEVMYIHYKGRGGFSAGWGKFVHANNLESDDVCAFELLKPYEVQVHIFRVVDEIIPLIWTNPRRKE